MATHGYTLSQAAEDRITDALPVLAIHIPRALSVERAARGAARPARGTRTAHHARARRAGDADPRVPRHRRAGDPRSYHRYTVDEHTFLTIDNIHGLRQPAHEFEQRLAQLLPEIERLDLFCSPCCCTHRQGRRTGPHASQSVELADSFLARLDFDRKNASRC